MATVHGFAAQSGGGIAIDSQPGQGTTVRLFLRALPPSSERTARENHRPPPLPPPIAPAASAAVILVVEDEARVRRVACRHLRDLGYPVMEAADAEEAIAILETEPDIQMVFSDIVMPGDLDGFGLASWIATHRPEAKCLLATGHHERASDAPRPAMRRRSPCCATPIPRSSWRTRSDCCSASAPAERPTMPLPVNKVTAQLRM